MAAPTSLTGKIISAEEEVLSALRKPFPMAR